MSKLGIIVAQEEEAHTLLNSTILEKYATIVVSGVGMLNAASAANDMISSGITNILNIGVSAGRGDLSVGDIVAVENVFNGDFDIRVFNHDRYYVPGVGSYIQVQGRTSNLKSLPCFSISYFLTGDIDTIYDNYVVDMEYYGIAHAGMKKGISTSSIKVVSDIGRGDNHLEYEENLKNCERILSSYILRNIGDMYSSML